MNEGEKEQIEVHRERETTCSGMITPPSAARLEHGSQSSQQRAWVPNTQSPTDLPQGRGLCHQAQGPWPPSRSQWPSHANSLAHTTPQKNGSVHYSVSQCQMSLQPQLQAVKAWTSYDGPTQMFIRSPKHLMDWSQPYSSLRIDPGWGLGLKAV